MPAPAQSSSRPLHYLLIFLALLAGALIRFGRIGNLSIWYDEGYTAWMVNHSPSEIIRLLKADTAPPLYYVLLHFWTGFFGRSEAGLRSMSAAFSMGTLLFSVPLARRFIRNPAAAIAAIWAVALSLPQLEYAQEARFYAMMGFLFTAAIYCLLRHLRSPGGFWLIPLIIVIAASLYTHNMMVPYLCALGLAWLILPSPHPFSRRLLDGVFTVFAAGLIFGPWAMSALVDQVRMVHGNFWVQRPSTDDIIQIISSLAGIEHMWLRDDLMQRWNIPLDSGNAWAAIGIFFIAISLLAGLTLQFLQWRDILALSILSLFPPLAIAAASYVTTPLFLEKIFLPSAALIPILIFLPLGTRMKIIRRIAWPFAGFYLLAVALTFYGYERVEQKEDWRSAARFVSDLPDHRRLIVFVGSDGQLPFDFYYHYRPDEKPTGTPTGFFDINPPRAMQQVLQSSDVDGLKSLIAKENYDEAVLVVAHGGWGDKNYYTWKMLSDVFPQEKETDFHDVIVVRFTRLSPISNNP